MLGARTRLPSRSLVQIAVGIAIASMGLAGVARADTDGIANTSNVPVVAHAMACAQVPTVGTGTTWTPSAFSFDISWVDAQNRAYYLADRSHNGVAAGNGGGGDVMVIDINSVNLTSANTQLPDPGTVSPEGFYMLPPATDPMAGIRCDQNAAFGGTTGVGRNELTGPNGAFTVNHTEVWVGDGPSNNWQPTQFDAGAHLLNPSATITTCASTGAQCTYDGKAQDYAADPCNSSVRVFDLVSRQQTDHINVHGCFRTDEGAFDPVDQIAIFANPSEQSSLQGVATAFTAVDHSPFVTLISTRPKAGGPTTQDAHKILKQINFDGTNGTVLADLGVEQAVDSKDTGLFYVMVPGTSSNPSGYVTVIDPRRDGDDRHDGDHDNDRHDDDGGNIHVVRNIALSGGCAPNGAALGPDFELGLFCSGNSIQVIDIRSGHLIRVISQTSGGCDEGSFNAGDNHFAGACTDGAAQDNIDVVDADPVQFDISATTGAAGAHSIAADPVTVSFWQPAAAAAAAGPSMHSVCGANPCVLIWKSTGGDDPGEFAAESHENH
jgi:hypothetical protein